MTVHATVCSTTIFQTVITWEALRMAVNANLTLVVPTTEERTVAPDMSRRRPNAELRSREHLTLDEVERLIAAAKQGRWGHRDATVILVAYRHGLRASELTRSAVGPGRPLDSQPSRSPGKAGHTGYPPNFGRRAAGTSPVAARASPQVIFTSERGGPFTTAGFARERGKAIPAR